MLSWAVWTAALCFGSLVNSQQLTACPSIDVKYNSVDGTAYSICPGTNFDSGYVSSVPASNYRECADKCNPKAGCMSAVFDTIDKVCHFKGALRQTKWVVDPRYVTIVTVRPTAPPRPKGPSRSPNTFGPVGPPRPKGSGRPTGAFPFNSTSAEGTVITECPWPEKLLTASNGKQLVLCANTQFRQSSGFVQKTPSPEACVELCAKEEECDHAVWDHIETFCRLMGKGKSTWIVSSRYDTLRPPELAEGTVIKVCPSVEVKKQVINGALWTVCKGTEYAGQSSLTQQVANQDACIDLCANTSGCTQASYDMAAKSCLLVEPLGQSLWKTSKKSSAIRLTKPALAIGVGGKWSEIINLPLIPVQGFVVPQLPDSDRLLLFSSYAAQDFGGDGGKTQFADYNWKTGAISQREVANTRHDMFCPGLSTLFDGRLVVTGGSSAAVTSIYDPVTNTFSRGPDMKIPRGYQSSTTLSNGNIYTIGGSWSGGKGGKSGEVYNPTSNTWTRMANADTAPLLTVDHEGEFRTDNHAWLYGWKNGSVFQAGPSRRMNWFDGTGERPVMNAGNRWTTKDEMCGVNVMYDAVAGKIFAAGGSQDYTNSDAVKAAFEITIRDPFQAAAVTRVPDMNFARSFANAVVLPDGTVFIVGGQAHAEVFVDTSGALSPEIYNPITKNFTVMSPMVFARNYHSIALLLADGTIFTGGGGMCSVNFGNSNRNCIRTGDHPNAQIFSPPYLFNTDGSAATRPVISGVSADKVRVGGILTVSISSQIDSNNVPKFSLIRLGSNTHSINTDQRRIAMTDVQQKANTGDFELKLPQDAGVILPGFYYVFAISQSGIPSVARTVQVTP